MDTATTVVDEQAEEDSVAPSQELGASETCSNGDAENDDDDNLSVISGLSDLSGADWKPSGKKLR
jgi:hypothetical protein